MSWAERSADVLRATSRGKVPFDENGFLTLAWYTRPGVGEPFSDYHTRAMACWGDLDAAFAADAAPQRENEPFADYAARAAPHLIAFVAGFSLEEIRPAIEVLAQSDPAGSTETLEGWIDRVLGDALRSTSGIDSRNLT